MDDLQLSPPKLSKVEKELTQHDENSPTTSASAVTSTSTSTAANLKCSETASSIEEETLVSLEEIQFDNDTSNQRTMVDATMQFPLDIAEDVFHEHSYCSHKVEEQSTPILDSSCEAEDTQVIQSKEADELSLSPPFSPDPEGAELDPDYEPEYANSSQSSQTCENVESLNPASSKRILLVYEENLYDLMKFCPRCGSPVNGDEIQERENEGSQFSVKLSCLSGCNFIWQSQPSIPGVKGEGNLALSAGLFFSGIQFAKFQQFSTAINLKPIGENCYYTLRDKYVFPVIDTHWEKEQTRLINTLKDWVEPVTLAGDGRCDSPGHSAKYGTYTMLDVASDQVVDFKVVSVCEVKNSNAMEKKGFIDALNFIEEAGVHVAGVSTDSHPQIKKYMREEQKNKKHHIDPWHAIKKLSQKIVCIVQEKGV